jgi:PAS domain S-box-containing protein
MRQPRDNMLLLLQRQVMTASLFIREEAFASAFDVAPIATALLGLNSRVQHANSAFCEMLGYTHGELLDLPPHALSHPQDRQNEIGGHARLAAGDLKRFECEMRFVRRDGAVVSGRLTCVLLRSDTGAPRHYLSQVQENSARNVESALRDSEARNLELQGRLRRQTELLDQSRDGIVVHDLGFTIRYWNLGAQRMFGFEREQAVGQTFGALMGSRAAMTAQATAELLAKGEWTGELDCIDASGRMLVVERRCTIFHGAEGEPDLVLAVNTDVTERRRAEKEIVLLNNLLEQRIRKRTAELEASNEDLRDFAYSLAHDLRAPLASIDGFSAQLESRLAGQLDDRSRHYIERLRAGVKLMSGLTDALLALADLSNTPLLHQSVDLSAVARGVMERLRELAPARDARVVIEDTPRAQGDVRLLTDVMENLLGNAWKFTSRTARADIVFSSETTAGGSSLYHVKDNGAGFDPAYAYKLFGPFQRLHTVSEFEGTGIGLAIVRKIVSRHGGRVWAESTPGAGASFYFTLNENASQHVARANLATAAP